MNEMGDDYYILQKNALGEKAGYYSDDTGFCHPECVVYPNADRIDINSKDIITGSDTYFLIKGDKAIS